jgi:cell division protein FtsB
MRKLTIPAPVLAALLALCLPPVFGEAQAQQRFQLERTEHGVVRLDTETGALTICREDAANSAGELICRMAPDERVAYEKELDLLEKRVTALEAQVSNMPPKAGGLPSDEDVDRSLSIMERFMRTFMGIVREFTGEPKPEPQPDRT